MAAKKTDGAEHVKETHKAPGNNGVFVAVVVVAIIAAFVLFGMQPQKEAPEIVPPINPPQTVSPQLAPGAKTLLDALGKVGSFPQTYQIAFKGNVRNTPVNVLLYSYKDGKSAAIETPYNTRTAYWRGNLTIMCEMQKGGLEICANVSGSKGAPQFMLGVGDMFINNTAAKSDLARDRQLVLWNALKVSDVVKNERYASRPCKLLTYGIDYGKLTLEQMREGGIGAGFDMFSATECLDDQFGIPLWINVTFSIAGQNGTFEREVRRFQTPLDGEIVMPVNLASESQLLSAFGASETEWGIMGACTSLNGTDADKCFRNGAADRLAPEYCERIANATLAGQCNAIIAVKTSSPSLCKKAAENRDDCLLQVALDSQNPKTCDGINSTEAREYCLNNTKTG